jgi:uncharacterized membrane protein
MKQYFTVLISLVVIDLIWLSVVAKSFYQKYLGYIFAEKFALWPAVIFYALYAFGLVFFVINPALESKSVMVAVLRGALFGLIAYATYDLTNQATIAKWPMIVTVVDLAWGIFVTALVSGITYLVVSRI